MIYIIKFWWYNWNPLFHEKIHKMMHTAPPCQTSGWAYLFTFLATYTKDEFIDSRWVHLFKRLHPLNVTFFYIDFYHLSQSHNANTISKLNLGIEYFIIFSIVNRLFIHNASHLPLPNELFYAIVAGKVVKFCLEITLMGLRGIKAECESGN